MKECILFLVLVFSASLIIEAQTGNLIANGDFKSLKSWKSNDNLLETGKVTLLPEEQGVTILNPIIDKDGALYQEIQISGHNWFSYSLNIKAGDMLRASVGFMALDESGTVIKIVSPVRVSGQVWNNYSGTIEVPENTKSLRVLLAVINGSCSFSTITLKKVDGPGRLISSAYIVSGKGFSVDSYSLDRPLWEIFCDDLDGDGKPELIGCDVDGIVTVRNQGTPAFMTYAAGALVYQFEAADLNNDGVKEILMSSVDPKIPIKAIDLDGKTIQVFEGSSGPERIVAADMDNDGNSEIAVTSGNNVAGSGIADGFKLYDFKGELKWEKIEKIGEFQIGDLLPAKGLELVAGGPSVNFRVYNIEGKIADSFSYGNSRLAHFILTDIDFDGDNEILASHEIRGNQLNLLCAKGKNKIWDVSCPPELGGTTNGASLYFYSKTMLTCGDFDKDISGKEAIIFGSNYLWMFDSKGNLIYLNQAGDYKEYWTSWIPAGIKALDITLFNSKEPQLFLSSSRYRHKAYYKLTFSEKDEFGSFMVPDEERHLEDIYYALKKQPPQASAGNNKVKVFIESRGAMNSIITASEEMLREYRKVLDSLETPGLEYLILWDASDLVGHERGDKLTIDQIVNRARLFEKSKIPFGIWMGHLFEVWITEEAIQSCKEAAPEMFRFVSVNENLEMFYSPGYKDWLMWIDKTLDFCSQHNMKMLFKQKHDQWGLLSADSELADILFSPEHKNVIVPVFSTNQPYQPEIQLGGMIGLKMAGLCNEFGMSTQFWNWHEWGRFPIGIRDISPAMICPSDIMLRLDLMGIALGATWINIEHAQPYFREDIRKGLAPMANRHRDLAFELIRKNVLISGATPVNINKTTIVRSLHQEIINAKIENKRIASPYYDRNIDALRKGFIPARYIFETYPKYAFPWLAYSLAWNVSTCFPMTPYGWMPVVPPQINLSPERYSINTDGEKLLIDNKWEEAEKSVSYVEKMIFKGAEDIPLEAPGTCLIIQKDNSRARVYTMLMIDPGYLAPTGVATTIKSLNGNILKATDMVSGESVPFSGNSCPVQIQPGAFRIVRVELNNK